MVRFDVIGNDSNTTTSRNDPDICSYDYFVHQSLKMPWMCLLCKICDVEVCIVIAILSTIAFILVLVAILILMH